MSYRLILVIIKKLQSLRGFHVIFDSYREWILKKIFVVYLTYLYLQDRSRRQGNSYGALFDLIDTERFFGHVSVDEFANFYTQYGHLIGANYSKFQWKIIYTQLMNKIDYNWNNDLEVTGIIFIIIRINRIKLRF